MKCTLGVCSVILIFNLLVLASTQISTTSLPEDALNEASKNDNITLSSIANGNATTVFLNVTTEKTIITSSTLASFDTSTTESLTHTLADSKQRIGENVFHIESRNNVRESDDTFDAKEDDDEEEEQARIEEIPDPSALYAENHQPSSKIAGLFGEKPFYLEKDPITGAVNFNFKTVKVGDSLQSDKFDDGSSDEEYYDEDDTGDGIDRKDVNINGALRPNDIIPYRHFPGNTNGFSGAQTQDYSNHKYSNDKFPIISSSYANTKVQGSIGTSNKKYYATVTSSTPSPFYYSMRTQGNYKPSSTSTTTIIIPVSSPAASATKSSFFDEENIQDGHGESIFQSDQEENTDISEETNSDKWESSKENSPHDKEYDGNVFDEEEYEDEVTSATDVNLKKQRDPPPVFENTFETEKPFRFTTTPRSQQISTFTSTIMNKIHSFVNDNGEPVSYKPAPTALTFTATTPHPSTTTLNFHKEPSLIPDTQQVATSMPLGTHFQYKPPMQTQTLPKQPHFNGNNPNKHQGIQKQPAKPNSSTTLQKQSESFSTNVVVGTEMRHQDVTGSFAVGNINANSDHIIKISSHGQPSSLFPDEPFRPIFGPDQIIKETHPTSRPENLHIQTTKLTGTKISSKLPSVISSADKDDYPVLFSKIQPVTTLPPKIVAVEPPRLESSSNFFQQPSIDPYTTKLSSHIKFSNPSVPSEPLVSVNYSPFNKDQKISHQGPLVQNIHVSSHVVFPDDHAHSGVVQSENILNRKDSNTVEDNVVHNAAVHQTLNVEDLQGYHQPAQKIPSPVRETLPEPSQHLTPPAESDQIRPQKTNNRQRPAWNTQSRPPPPKFFSQGHSQQNARPKVDNIKPNFIKGSYTHPGNLMRPNNNHGRPNIPRTDINLPNILPQFRPNAKISHIHNEHSNRIHLNSQRQSLVERPINHPLGSLPENLRPPPPLPHIRINRNDDVIQETDLEEPLPFEKFPPIPPTPPLVHQRPLVHRRTGPQASNIVEMNQAPVTTLQMMQQQANMPQFSSHLYQARDNIMSSSDINPSSNAIYPSVSEKEKNEKHPVYVVYPVNSGSGINNDNRDNSDHSSVVIGTRGPQLPLPPDNLNDNASLSPDNLNQLDSSPFTRKTDQVPILQLQKEKHYTSPLLNSLSRSNSTEEKPNKSDFPYPIEQPGDFKGDENSKNSNSTGLKYDTNALQNENSHMFSKPIDENIEAEVHNSKISEVKEEAEINIIPYLQDYMPYATKKPHLPYKPIEEEQIAKDNSIKQWPSNNGNQEKVDGMNKTFSSLSEHNYSSPSPISVTLKTIASPPFKLTDFKSQYTSQNTLNMNSNNLPPSRQQAIVGSSGSEFTLSASMHAPSQQQENHRFPTSSESIPSPSSLPLQQNFQVPFLASANVDSSPTNQGWSVVTGSSNERKRPGTVDTEDIDDEDSDAASTSNREKYADSDPSNFDFENFKPELIGGFKPIYTFPAEDDNSSEDTKREQLLPSDREEKKIEV